MMFAVHQHIFKRFDKQYRLEYNKNCVCDSKILNAVAVRFK